MRPLRTLACSAFLGILIQLGTPSPSTAKRPDYSPARLDAELRLRGLDPDEVTIPFALTSEMKAFARQSAPKYIARAQKLERLVAALLDQDALELQYSFGYTGTAAEVFETRRANCLAFTNLFVGLAREVGVPVVFYAVPTETYRRDRDFVVVSDHVAAGLSYGPDVRIYDFSENRVAGDLSRARPIDDLYLIAMFHSNQGAEALQRGELEAATRSLRIAVTLEPAMANSWVNLGVALRRSGDFEGAETAYRKALHLDPGTFSAYQNLATLLRLAGRPREAMEFTTALERSPSRNPFSFITLGDIFLREGRIDEARGLYRRAASMDSSLAESFAALGTIAIEDGNLREARRLLRKAQRIDIQNPRTVDLARSLSRSQS